MFGVFFTLKIIHKQTHTLLKVPSVTLAATEFAAELSIKRKLHTHTDFKARYHDFQST